jgi:FkbM family methyltransferase
MNEKLHGLFINVPDDLCSIYESGVAFFRTLEQSEKLSVDYLEVDKSNNEIPNGFDFYVFNYHWVKMGWLDTRNLRSKLQNIYAICLEVEPNNPLFGILGDHFDGYLVLDPTIASPRSNILGLPRPIPVLYPIKEADLNLECPIVGTFGLSYVDKGIDEVVRAVVREFDTATVKINIPTLPSLQIDEETHFRESIAKLVLGTNVKTEITSNNFSQEELISWCAQNDLNAFFYTRRIGNGLAATTDQALASGTPIAISTNPTFRHLMSAILPYPYWTLRDAMVNGPTAIKNLREDWGASKLIYEVENLIISNRTRVVKTSKTSLRLPQRNRRSDLRDKLSKVGGAHFVPPLISIVFYKIRNQVLIRYKRESAKAGNKSDGSNPFFRNNSVAPYSHVLLESYSHAHEDILLDFFLGKKSKGVYVDVGANDPIFGNNTYRFYKRGWRGINIDPNLTSITRLNQLRPGDVNIQVAVSDFQGIGNLQTLGSDTSISSLNSNFISIMSEVTDTTPNSNEVTVTTLAQLLDENLTESSFDFLTVDAEGNDLQVLKGNDWEKYRPSYVLVEANKGASEIVSFMESQNYLYLLSNSVNAFFIDKQFKSEFPRIS